MVQAFDPATFIRQEGMGSGRLCVGFAVPRRLAGRLSDADRIVRGDGLILFGDVTLYNGDSIGAERTPAAGYTSGVALLHPFLREGGDPARLNGDFAFGMYDENKRTLTLVRDQIGNRIIYYAHRPQGLVFSTRIHALFEAGFDRRDLDPMALASFLVMRSPGAGRTYYPGISELEPAYLLDVRPGRRPAKKRYWSLQPDSGLDFKQPEGWIDHIRSVFVQAVTSRMAGSERPGLKLSGGLDSSSIAGVMCSRYPDLAIRGFAHVPSQPSVPAEDDDAPYLKAVDDLWGNLSLNRVRSDRFDVLSGPGYWQHVAAAPCIDPFFFAENALAQTMFEENIDVVLSGYAGDHCFSGYSHPVLVEQLAGLRWSEAAREIRRLQKQPDKSIFDIIAGRIVARLVPAHLKNARKAFLGRPWHADLAVSADFLANRDFMDHLRQNRFHALMNSPLTMRGQYRQNITAEMSHFIAFEDRFENEHGYHSRRPMLDIGLLQAVMSAPSDLVVGNRHDRALIRKVAGPFMPASVCERSGKSPFVPDYPTRLAPSARRLADQISDFRSLDTWRQVTDVAKVDRMLDVLGNTAPMSDAYFVRVLHLALMPYYAGHFIQESLD